MAKKPDNIHAKPLDEILNFIQGDTKKKSQKKTKKLSSQPKLRALIDEELKNLRELNGDLLEVNINIKQTQVQLNQLQETNGKNKKQRMTTAQNNLKNLNKRHAQLEKEAKTMLSNVRGLSTEVDLEKECQEMTAVKGLVPLLSKKKKPEEVKEVASEQPKAPDDAQQQKTPYLTQQQYAPDAAQEQNCKPIDPGPSKSRFYSLFGASPIFGATFAKPPHFSEFNNAPRPEISVSKVNQNGMESLRIPSSTGATPMRRNQVTMQNYRANPSSCLVKNANGVYTVRKSTNFPNPLPSQYNASMNSYVSSSPYYSSNLMFDNNAQSRQPPPPLRDPLQLRDREIDPLGCWKAPQSSSTNSFSKP